MMGNHFQQNLALLHWIFDRQAIETNTNLILNTQCHYMKHRWLAWRVLISRWNFAHLSMTTAGVCGAIADLSREYALPRAKVQEVFKVTVTKGRKYNTMDEYQGNIRIEVTMNSASPLQVRCG
jgi:hypothetical protein